MEGSEMNMNENTMCVCDMCGREVPSLVFRLVKGDFTIGVCPDCLVKLHSQTGYVLKSIGVPMPTRASRLDRKEQERAAMPRKEELKPIKVTSPTKIKEYLDRFVIGQEKAKKILAVGVYNHCKRLNNSLASGQKLGKSNILMLGPTGVGKTALARTIAGALSVPFALVGATGLTAAGYRGVDLDSILCTLVRAAQGDVREAERGIIYVDEIDKIAKKIQNADTRDVSGESIQHELLRMIEGAEYNINVDGKPVTINTDNILFICGGAFEGITMKRKETVKAMGFGSELESVVETDDDSLDNITKKLVELGMIPELVGRLPVVARLNALTEDELCKVLTDTENCVTGQYEALLALDGHTAEFSDEALRLVARKANEKGTGARGLRSILEDEMLDFMFEAPDMEKGHVLIGCDGEHFCFDIKPEEKVLEAAC